MTESHHRLGSVHLGNERDIWVRTPENEDETTALLVFLDGELYRDRVQAPVIVDSLHAEAKIQPAISVYVSYASPAARWIECPCHPPFAAFIIEELMPWLECLHPQIRRCTERVLIGLSYTGLAASHVALQTASPFTVVISQSGSYWSDDGWLTREYARLKTPRPVRFYLEVGLRETQTNIRHTVDVLQVMSQLDAVCQFGTVLKEQKHVVHFKEFDGGHEFTWWSHTLPAALCWAVPYR
jgi:enterochelin esterase-like enzyme